MEEYTDEQIFEAMRAADAAGDAEAVKALAAALKAGKTQDEIETVAANVGLEINKDQLAANIASRDAGGPVNEVLPPQRDTVQDLAVSAVNTPVGYAQGAIGALLDFPLDVASGVQSGTNALLDVAVGGGLDLMGFPQAANAFRDTGAAEEAIRARRVRASDAIETALPPPEGFETQRDVAEFSGGFLLPGPKGARLPIRAPAPRQVVAPSEAAATIAEGARRNVPVMTSDVRPPQSRMGTFVTQTLPEKIPLFGTSGPRAAQQEARQKAVSDLVSEFGGNPARDVFDGSITPAAEVSKLLTSQRSQRLTSLTTAKNSVIDGVQGVAPVTETIKALDDKIAEMVLRDTPASREVADVLRAQREELIKPRTLRGLEDFRKDELSNAFNRPDTLVSVKAVGEKALRSIYDPLRRDMGTFIDAQAGGGARAKWSKANEELSALAGEMTSTRFKNVLSNADTTPDVVGRILFSSEADPADIQRLVSNLDDTGKAKVRSAIIQRAFDNAGGKDGVSPETFMNNLGRLSKQIGVAFTGRERDTLMGFRRLMDATRRAAVASSEVRTGEQALPLLLGFSFNATGVGVGGLIARLYESAPVRNLLVRLSRTKQGTPQERQTLNLLMRSSAPIVNSWKENMARAVNDNPSAALAAEEQPNEPN